MRTVFLIVIATMLLVVAFFAFFPDEALMLIGEMGGPRTVGLTMDNWATHIRWAVGAISFAGAIGTYVKAFT